MKKSVLIITFCCLAMTSFAQKKPVIGLTTMYSDVDKYVSTNTTYVESIQKAGGVPVLLPLTASNEYVEQMIDLIDGLVVIGGEDINPNVYGEEPIGMLGAITHERDAYDVKILKSALEKGIPVFAICRGHQMTNAISGGTLYQDLPSQYKGGNLIKHRQQTATWGLPTHSVTIDKNSELYKILGEEKIYVNSYHHQAVKDVAPGFRVVAKSSDGVIEAIEKIGEGSDLIISVQWHPEGMVFFNNDTQMLKLFKYLVEKASVKK